MSYSRSGRLPRRHQSARVSLGAAGAAAAPAVALGALAAVWGATRRRPPVRDHVVKWYLRGKQIDQWGPMPLASAKGQLTRARKGAGPGDTFKIVKIRSRKG